MPTAIILFLVLKLAGVLSCSWWWILLVLVMEFLLRYFWSKEWQ